MSVSKDQRDILNRYPYPSSLGKVKLGDAVSQQGALVIEYDVARDGGAVGSISSKATLPAGAIITKSYLDIVTAFTSAGGTGTIAVSAFSTDDVLAPVDADTLSGQVAGIQDGAVANMIKASADSVPTIDVGTEALTAGKANVYLEWVQSE